MRFAIISDIHNNLEAFRSTLDDIERQKVDKICCLGDLLGYGPDPIKCVDLMLDLRRKGKLEVCLPGNHDQAAMFEPLGFNYMAEAAVNWTREQLEKAHGNRAVDRLDFLGELQIQQYYRKDELLFVHGSPRNRLNEYVFEEDVEDPDKMSRIFNAISQQYSAKYCFVGHTHVPGVFVNKTVGMRYEYRSYDEIRKENGGVFRLGPEETLVNVGSVGQPRDGDWRSCYVILNYEPKGSDNFIEFHRVEYDVEKTVAAFAEIPELAKYPFLAQRIREGR
ncbi:MAG: metallophosphoesterase family protein [Thermoguttaceae bacterium]|nr:metallophosphoesterase family protein [Thermoguttaceae bacterium]MBQ2040443.1 metallophosphoesterase family protein [Thermoguttaceae bacterium]MBQ2554959.1 metallophosphoesterase family protein [Thermoguttaceae bacterium]MBQ5366495.1 metallophosphoesterase family protein [Thermoguttaceae bacterium]